MRNPMLVEYYQRLPEPQEDEPVEGWRVRWQDGLAEFRQLVTSRYTEGTLQRLTNDPIVEVRRAAALALGLSGTFPSNKYLAEMLHDPDAEVCRLAHDALWSLWFRADTESNNRELQRIMRLRDSQQALAAFDVLLKKAPSFAEAYNQRAILYFRMNDFPRSITDCETALKLNPCHFGAQSGMGQCYLKLHKPKLALRAFQQALRINPNLDGVQETIRTLEEVLGGEEGKTEDKSSE